MRSPNSPSDKDSGNLYTGSNHIRVQPGDSFAEAPTEPQVFFPVRRDDPGTESLSGMRALRIKINRSRWEFLRRVRDLFLGLLKRVGRNRD